MKLFHLLLSSVLAGRKDRKKAAPFTDDELELYGDLSKREWNKIYKDIDPEMEVAEEDFFLKFKRQVFNSGRSDKRRRGFDADEFRLRFPRNQWDVDGTCPDSVSAVSWDYPSNADVTITNRVVIVDRNVDAGVVKVLSGGKLIFKDNGPDGNMIKFRAMALKAENTGEIWAGSRSCRYQGKLDIALYGNHGDHERDFGYKYFHCDRDGVVEVHGKEKHHWTHLEDHLFKNSVAVEQLNWSQDRNNNAATQLRGQKRMVFHILSAEGDLKDTFSIATGEEISEDVQNMLSLENLNNGEIVIFFTDLQYTLRDSFRELLENLGFENSLTFARKFNDASATFHKKKWSQIAGIINTGTGESDLQTSIPEDWKAPAPLYQIVGPIGLGGEKAGFDFGIEMKSTWGDSDIGSMAISDFQEFLDNPFGSADAINFWNGFAQRVEYTSSTKGQTPKIKVSHDISSWEVGDKIVIASTDQDPLHSEVFEIQPCGDCDNNEIMLDRPADFTHWGRVDQRTGIDQRAEVGLLSRNIRFYGEMQPTCDYARTRESLDGDSPNRRTDWCGYFEEMEGENIDRHGGHIVGTKKFRNFHISHIEVFNAGQPWLARYPVHWHHAGYVGRMGGYEDPSSFESLSIHDCFSRFVTVHGTHEATVKNVVGYNTVGHGFFMEDGVETYNHITGNLGIVVKPGIILPTDRDGSICEAANDQFDGAAIGREPCEALSVFWMSHAANWIHDNAAVGGTAGFWFFHHTASEKYAFEAMQPNETTGRREWRNNKASAATYGMIRSGTVKDDGPTAAHPAPFLSMLPEDDPTGLKYHSMPEKWEEGDFQPNEDRRIDDLRPNLWERPESNWADEYFVGFKVHHTTRSNKIEGANVHIENWQVSDNAKGFELVTSEGVFGAKKTIKDSTFVGFTRNTGHMRCGELSQGDSIESNSLDELMDCSIDDQPQLPKPNSVKEYNYSWYKPMNDVYRQAPLPRDEIQGGIVVSASSEPTIISNNFFFDFFPDRAGFGAIRAPIVPGHNSRFTTNPENVALHSNVFENCPLIFGDDKLSYDNAADRETFAVADVDGRIASHPGYILRTQNPFITTGCEISTVNADFPVHSQHKLCPFSTQIGQLDVAFTKEIGGALADNASKNEVQFDASTKLSAVVESGKTVTFKPDLDVNFIPTGDIFIGLTNAKEQSEFRFSICVFDENRYNIGALRERIGHDGLAYSFNTFEWSMATSFEDLASSVMPIAYFQDDGWIHFKLTETKDRREGGFFIDSNGNSYSVADSEDYFTSGWPFVGLETASYPFSTVDGKLKVHLGDRYNSDTRLSGKQIASSGNCGDFNDGATTTTTTTEAPTTEPPTEPPTTTAAPTTTTAAGVDCSPLALDMTTNNFEQTTPGKYNPAAKYPYGLGSPRSASIKYLIKKWNLHKSEYLGFLTFGQHFCGSDFLAAIDDGRLQIDFVDNRHVYQYTGQTGFKDNGSFSKKTLQFIARGSEENIWGAGSANWVDVVFVQIHGIDTIDWQGKETVKCFEKARIGFENNANAYSEAVNNDVNYADCIVNA